MSTGVLSRTVSQPLAAKAGATFVNDLAICLLLMSLPINNFGYIVPPVYVALQIWAGNFASIKRSLMWLSIALCVSAASILFDNLAGGHVNLPGLFVSLLTYAQLFVILGVRADFKFSEGEQQRLITILSWWIIVQSLIGVFQFVASNEPDAVSGTMGLFDFLSGDFKIAQVYFTFNLFAMILYLVTDLRRPIAKIAVAVGLIAVAVAHSGHQTLFMMAALGFVGVLQMRPKDLVKLFAAVVLLLGVTAAFSRLYVEDLDNWIEYTASSDSPKQTATLAGANILSTPKNFLVGTGMGQFASRAALIVSGEHLSVRLPESLMDQSDYYRHYLRPSLAVFMEDGQGSAISKPYYSVLNLLVEFGVPATLLLFGALAVQFFRNQRLAKSKDKRVQIVGLVANVGIVFLVLCCFIENYVEFPQATFVPMLLYIAAQAKTAPLVAADQQLSNGRG